MASETHEGIVHMALADHRPRRPLLAVAAISTLCLGLTACHSDAGVTVTPGSTTGASSFASGPESPSTQHSTSVPTVTGPRAASGSEQLQDPKVGQCVNDKGTKWFVVDCSTSHEADISAVVPSKWDGHDQVARAALRTWTCEDTAASYLGGPIGATFFGTTAVPTAVDPRSDDRIVCLTVRFGTGPVDKGGPIETTGSMHGVLSDPKSLARHRVCLDQVSSAASPSEVHCSQEHRSEAVTTVSLGSATAPYVGATKIRAKLRKVCAPRVRTYLGGVQRGDLKVGVWGPSAANWRQGGRTVTCFINVKSGKLTKSVKGIGKKPLKDYR